MGNIRIINFNIHGTSENRCGANGMLNITFTNAINIPRMCKLFKGTTPDVPEQWEMSRALILISTRHPKLNEGLNILNTISHPHTHMLNIHGTSENQCEPEYPIPLACTNVINVPRICELFRETTPVYTVLENCKTSGALILMSKGHPKINARLNIPSNPHAQM
jgi:hypothetical protein